LQSYQAGIIPGLWSNTAFWAWESNKYGKTARQGMDGRVFYRIILGDEASHFWSEIRKPGQTDEKSITKTG
jgi:hypothetical protein